MGCESAVSGPFLDEARADDGALGCEGRPAGTSGNMSFWYFCGRLFSRLFGALRFLLCLF